jgi:hypothetical protein
VIRVLIYVVTPAISLILAAPAASTLLPWNIRYVESLGAMHALLLAFYFGVLTAPGYLYAFITRATASEVSTSTRWWVRCSLCIAALCSLVGVIAGIWMILFAPPSLVALYASSNLLLRFEGRRSRAKAPGRTGPEPGSGEIS